MQSTSTVLVTEHEYSKGRAAFEQAISLGLECVSCSAHEHEMAQRVQDLGARHVVVGVAPYRDVIYDALPQGGVLARFGVGADNLDLVKATEQGVFCTNTPSALDDSVAEFAISLMTVISRGTLDASDGLRQGKWLPQLGQQLKGKKLAVIGCGRIGRNVGKIASYGFGMRVFGCVQYSTEFDSLIRDYGFEDVTTSFDMAVADADFVSLHLPGSSDTRHYIDWNRILRLPEQAWLINTSRGSVVNESDLHEALESGVLRGAALDVFENEPYSPVSPEKDLRLLPNVLLTPHISSSTTDACAGMARMAIQNIQFAECGDYLKMNLLNPEVITREEQVAKGFA